MLIFCFNFILINQDGIYFYVMSNIVENKTYLLNFNLYWFSYNKIS